MFQGSMVAIATPMHESGDIDFEALDRLVDYHLENGTDAIVPAGTTGESATLDFDEHCDVVRRVIGRVAGRVPVIAGTGANSTSEAMALTRAAHELGADACLLVTPYYNKPTQEGLYRHYRSIAEALPIPQIPYNVPGRTACDMLPETVERLADIPNIVGLKEATGDVTRTQELVERCGDRLEIYCGEDVAALETMLHGARGVISVTANVAPRAMHELCMAALNGDPDTAREINHRIEGLHRDLFAESNPIPVKWALHQMGLMPAGIRLPLTPLAEQYHDRLRDSMRQAGL